MNSFKLNDAVTLGPGHWRSRLGRSRDVENLNAEVDTAGWPIQWRRAVGRDRSLT
eukprot:CAMPEP_0181288932 /NCGR_PEP_ID=MMETSP1101-20121128/610_1 /TAXON_ID=46948 /ORGANISM="Rhodomonas abbreviata, Strain Caron Lab Isolate" /LENGTH=54 /DNA_ID=CAMNT_0023393115 /DNA_START=241 /DNA_END=406 /DNA_ORIENTATION=+